MDLDLISNGKRDDSNQAVIIKISSAPSPFDDTVSYDAVYPYYSYFHICQYAGNMKVKAKLSIALRFQIYRYWKF